MGAYSPVALRASLAATGVVFALASGAGVVRLLPWLAAPDVPLAVAVPFARVLAGVAIETGALVGVPVGFAIAIATLADRGDLRALHAMGVSPWGVVCSGALVAGGLSCAAAGAAYVIDPGSGTPGRLASHLIERGRSSCAGSQVPRSARVPATGLTWFCFPNRPPTVAGAVPRSRGQVWFSARSLAVNDDLSRLRLRRLEVFAPSRGSVPAVRVRVARANIKGLPPWGRPEALAEIPRALVVSASILVLGLCSAMATALLGIRFRWIAAIVGAVSGVLVVTLIHKVDDLTSNPWVYTLVPVAGSLPWLLAQALASIMRRGVRPPHPQRMR